MKTMNWLLKREYWEHKGMLLWAPAVIGGLMVVMAAVMMAFGHNVNMHIDGDNPAVNAANLISEHGSDLALLAANVYPLLAAPLYLALSFIVFFYCLGALYDERRDRSILFWKSLPISDSMSVLSKVAVALVATPVVVVVLACATGLLIMLGGGLLAAAKGVNLFGALFSTPSFWLTPFKLLSLVPVYLLWALPTVGWLLMVSSWARSKVFLWAVGAPLMVGILAGWMQKAFHLGIDVGRLFHEGIARLLLSVLPAAWLMFDEKSQEAMHQGSHTPLEAAAQINVFYMDAWRSLAGVEVWLWAAAGVAMIAAAVWMRRWREEG